MKRLVFTTLALLFSQNTLADTPICYEAGYCAYTGKVKRVYVNASDKLLIYFETPTTVEEAAKAGLTITQLNAAQITISNDPDYAKMAQNLAVTAQVTGRNIGFQMTASTSSYLLIDKIWLN